MSAADRIDELKKRYDENPRRFFASLANEYRKAGDLDQAISLCQTHLAEQPGNMNGHVVYGQALFEAGRYDEAKTTFETALTLDPENLIALRHLGDIACTNGANDQAKVWYERVLDADPRNDEIIALLAHLATAAKPAGADAPITSAESTAPSEAATQQFRPPQVSTPMTNPTPIVPIESVNTVVIPSMAATPVTPTPVTAPPASPPPASPPPASPPPASPPPASPAPASPAPRESSGPMDISLDFETNLPAPASAPASPAANATNAADAASAASAAAGADDDFPSFGDLNFGTQPPDAPPPTPELVEGLMDPYAGETPEEMQEYSPPAEPAAPFVTETMAELYLQQGFRAEALDVYRQLSAQFPDDEKLKQRVRRLARGDRSSISLDTVPDPSREPSQEPVQEFTPAPLPELTAPVVAAARGVRAYFAGLASRRAVRPERPERPERPAAGVAAASAPVATPSLGNGRSGGSLDALFGGAIDGAISAEDEHVALAFAQVAGAVEMGTAAVKGKPTAPAASELSLDSVFREADARVTGTTVPRQSQTLRFDQFFSTAEADSSPPPPPPPSPAALPASPEQAQQSAAPAGEPGSPAELKQFHSWLTEIKKP